MKRGYNYIRNVIVNDYKISNLNDYSNYLKNRYTNSIVPTEKEIDTLHPDKIDCFSFWRLAEQMFGFDPVCNQVDSGPNASDILQANRNNLSIARTSGILDFFPNGSIGNILEIGPGYGSLKNYIEVNTNLNYLGFDVYPKSKDVKKLSHRGLFNKDISKYYSLFDCVVSTNVFQHLSKKQRIHFIVESFKLLKNGGLFIFNVTVDDAISGHNEKMRAKDGNLYTMFYGQFTPLFKFEFYKKELEKAGFIVFKSSVMNKSSFATFTCLKPQ